MVMSKKAGLCRRQRFLVQTFLQSFLCTRSLSSVPAAGTLVCDDTDPASCSPPEREQVTEGAIIAQKESPSVAQKEVPLRWAVLPAVPRLSLLARVAGTDKQLTALKWVSKCCPDIPHSAIEKLFRLRQVRVWLSMEENNDGREGRLQRISRKAILQEGSLIYLPKLAPLLNANKDENSERIVDTREARRSSACKKKEYLPTDEDIDWARELILHKDTHIIAINKPPGLAVQGGVGVGRNLDVLLGPAFSFNYDEIPKLVHRLDKETSGIMVIGRTAESTALLHSFFRKKTEIAIAGRKTDDEVVKRKYWAVVIGTPERHEGCIKASLKKLVLDGGKSEAIVTADGDNSEDVMEAVTEYKVLGPSVHGCTWLELHPLTGRKHQIRVHCAKVLGTPIVGDYKYGRRANEDLCSRVRDSEGSQVDGSRSRKSRSQLPSSGGMVEGSVMSQTPFLHLHSRLLSIPKVKPFAKESPTSAGPVNNKVAFVHSLRLLAPLPPHMKATWLLRQPILKGPS